MEERKNKSNILIIILFILLLIAVGIICYLLGSSSVKQSDNNSENTTEQKENNETSNQNLNEEETVIEPTAYTRKCIRNSTQQNILMADIDETKYNNVVEYIKHQENIKITVAYCDENSEKEIDGVAHFDLTEYVLTDSEKNNSLNEISNMKLSIGEGGIGGGPCVPITTISYKKNNSSYFVKYLGNILQESNDGNIYKIIDKTSDAPQSQEYCFYYIESLGSTIDNITKYER